MSVKSTIRRSAGHAIGALLSGLRAHRAAIGNSAVVFLFHRVDDRIADDPLTVSRGQFKDWCRFISDYFDVVPYDEIVSDMADGNPLHGKAAITFDDGYRDNYINATPVLSALGLDATFFITTNFIESNKKPAWDRHLPVDLEWMSWDEVRMMRDGGFGIENHTLDHLDFGQIDAGEARRQLEGASAQIERELGYQPKHFAYPFGGAQHMTEANRDVVRSLGFASCCTAMNRLARPSTDRFGLHRYAINEPVGSTSLALGHIARLAYAGVAEARS